MVHLGNILASVAASAEGGGYDLIIALVTAVIAAVVGGFVAAVLRQPIILGYLFGGLLIGPYTPGPRADVSYIQIMAEIGVALLMFALGTEFSLQELKHVGKPAITTGLVLTITIILIGIPVGWILNLQLSSGIFLGGLLAISSSVVLLKLLLSRGELESIHGKIGLGVSIVQDLCVIVLVVVLPALGGGGSGSDLAITIVLALVKGFFFLVGSYLIGTRIIPWLLEKVILLGMREMFLLVVISIALGMAILAYVLGISFALGAFIAGIIVSGSEAASDVLSEIIPFRDVFASLFFVSIGMLIDPVFLWNNLPAVLLLVATVIIGKWLIASTTLLVFKQPVKTAMLTGLLLAQVGEFSFVLARIGVDSKAITSSVENMLLSAALVTIMANPFLIQAYPTFASWANTIGGFFRRLPRKHPSVNKLPDSLIEDFATQTFLDGMDPVEDWNRKSLNVNTKKEAKTPQDRWPYKKHVIVCGYGRVGRELVDACLRRNFDVVLIEFDQRRLEMARKKGVVSFFGDASVEATLKQANIAHAKVLAITVPDLVVAEATTRLAHRLNSSLEIITRANEARAVALLKQVGATEVVQPEFEGGMEFIRRTARLYGVGGVELQGLLNGRRSRYYGQKES